MCPRFHLGNFNWRIFYRTAVFCWGTQCLTFYIICDFEMWPGHVNFLSWLCPWEEILACYHCLKVWFGFVVAQAWLISNQVQRAGRSVLQILRVDFWLQSNHTRVSVWFQLSGNQEGLLMGLLSGMPGLLKSHIAWTMSGRGRMEQEGWHLVHWLR